MTTFSVASSVRRLSFIRFIFSSLGFPASRVVNGAPSRSTLLSRAACEQKGVFVRG